MVGNDAVFWAVGDQGKVFKIVNGDIESEFTLGNGGYDLHGVSFFPGGQTGYIVGYKRDTPDRWKGIVFRTLSGGTYWESRYPQVQDGICVPFLKVQCVPSHYVWVTCGDGFVLWSNEWTNWQRLTKPAGEDDFSYIWGLWCLDSLHGWVATDESMLIAKTENMMTSWSAYRPFPDDSLSYRGIGPWDTYQPDFVQVAVMGSRGRVITTTNGGSNWAEQIPLEDTCQWWRGISHDHGSGNDWVGTSGTWLQGQYYGSHHNPRCSKDYDFNDVEYAGQWHIAVGTNEAIFGSFDTFGVSEKCELTRIDAISSSSTRCTLDIYFHNPVYWPCTTYVRIYRSICCEDWGTEPGQFYELYATIGPYYIQEGDTVITWVTNQLPYDIVYWFGATMTSGYTTCPNVDSAIASGASHHDPIPAPDYLWATDFPNDHGWKMQFEWDEVTGATQYAVIRPGYGHMGGLITVTSSTTNSDSKALPGYEYRRGVRSLDGVTSSASFAQTYGSSVDNIPPPQVTGLAGRYVPQLDACEIWWNPTPEDGEPGQPATYEPNLGGYWVCPEISGMDDYTINHQSPLFRNHYIERVPERCYDHEWGFAVRACDRTGNQGEWSDWLPIEIPKLGTTSPTATAYNNGTHLARLPGTANEHVVYENNDEVRYASSTDGGNVWQNRTTLDTGALPAIAMDESAHVWVVYLRDNVLQYKFSNPGTAWGGGVLYDPDDANMVLGPPTIAARTSSTLHYAYAAFPVYDLNAGTSVVKVVKFDETTAVVVNVEATPNQAMSDSFVSLSLTPGDSVHCCWQRGSSILYSEARVAPSQWSSITWTNPATLSQQGTVAKHPFCADWGNRVIVVWSDHGTGEIMRISRLVATPTTWSLPANVSNTEQFSDFPQASSPCAVSWQDLKGSGKWEVRARAGTELVTLTSDANGNSRYAHISAELADSTDSDPAAVYAVWTDGTAEDDYYEVKSCVWGQGGDGGMTARQVPIAVTELSSVAPNPFSRSTGIHYQLARAGRTRLSVFDAAGREVSTLVNSEQNRGAYTVTWNGTDMRGRSVPRGIYFLRFAAPECTMQRKLTLTR